ncbi:MAG: tetratricopeptide repeat protein, partial [Candidatus Heimdallarchaeaceae archaeon]
MSERNNKIIAKLGKENVEKLLSIIEVSKNEAVKNPKDPEPLINIASCHIYLENFEKALYSARKALEVQTDSPDVLYKIATSLIELKRYEEAEEAAQKGLDFSCFNESDAFLWLILGRAQGELGKHTEAEISFGNAISTGCKSGQMWFNYGVY